jgi:hypothetical protein
MTSSAALMFGWLIPGGVYLLSRRYAQFAVTFALVCVCLAAGIALQGSTEWPTRSDLQGLDEFTTATARAGALTKILTGVPYLIAKLSGHSQSFVSGQVHEYGTTFLLAAGLINLMALAESNKCRI